MWERGKAALEEQSRSHSAAVRQLSLWAILHLSNPCLKLAVVLMKALYYLITTPVT